MQVGALVLGEGGEGREEGGVNERGAVRQVGALVLGGREGRGWDMLHVMDARVR